jgi:hypothetical protein
MYLHLAGTGLMAAPKHEAPQQPNALTDRFRNATSLRALLLGVGVLLLQLAFILSYIAAFHWPSADRIPVLVVAPKQVAAQVADELNALPGQPVLASASDDVRFALDRLRAGETSGVYVVSAADTHDFAVVASGGGASVETTVENLFDAAAKQYGRTVSINDAVPLDPGDTTGLSGFYLVIGWAVGGVLFAVVLALAKGSRPTNLRRLVATVPYAVAAGLGGAVIAGPVLGAVNGGFWWIAGIGVLVTLSAATVTLALQRLFGAIGIGLAVVIFVILGNSSAVGFLPTAAGTEAIRRIVYFESQGVMRDAMVLAGWIIGGVVVTVVASAVRKRARQ